MRATGARSARYYVCRSSACVFASSSRGLGGHRLDVRVIVVHLVVHPSCSHCECLSGVALGICWGREGSRTGQLVRHVLVELVAKLVGADQGAGLGVTCCSSSASPLHVQCASMCHTNVLFAEAIVSVSHHLPAVIRVVGSRTYLELVPEVLGSIELAEAQSGA